MTRNPKDNRDKVDNWNLILGSAKMAGCRVVRITSEACAQGNETQIQTVLWEIIRVAQETRVKKLKVPSRLLLFILPIVLLLLPARSPPCA